MSGIPWLTAERLLRLVGTRVTARTVCGQRVTGIVVDVDAVPPDLADALRTRRGLIIVDSANRSWVAVVGVVVPSTQPSNRLN